MRFPDMKKRVAKKAKKPMPMKKGKAAKK